MHFSFFKFAKHRESSEGGMRKKPHSFAGFDSHGQDRRPSSKERERKRDTLKSSNERVPYTVPSPLSRRCPLHWRPLNVQRFSLKLNANAEQRAEKSWTCSKHWSWLRTGEGRIRAKPLPLSFTHSPCLLPRVCVCAAYIATLTVALQNATVYSQSSLSVYLRISRIRAAYICRCCWMRNVVASQNFMCHTAHGWTTRWARQNFIQSDGARPQQVIRT